jgi:methylthioribose-1-phosphate isomerase
VSDPRATTAVVQAVQWSPDGALRIVDQRRLPGAFVERDLRTVSEVADAIRSLAVRGAPAIGVAAAMGLVASLREAIRTGAVARSTVALADLRAGAEMLRATRPTAVNLGWAIDRMLAVAARSAEGEPAAMLETLHGEAEAIRAEDAAMCQAMGAHGAALLRDGIRVLTHCNAGALATAGIGTALAPIYVAHAAGVKVAVVACETRPLLQGARLTAWELRQAGVPVTLIADSMAASVMAAGRVDLVLVGADLQPRLARARGRWLGPGGRAAVAGRSAPGMGARRGRRPGVHERSTDGAGDRGHRRRAPRSTVGDRGRAGSRLVAARGQHPR